MPAVVIRTKNEAARLEAVLRALSAQQPRPSEVLIVDSGSTDSTVQIAQRWGATLLHLPAQQFTYGRALNVGLRATQDSLVAIVSGHAVPTSASWLANLTAPFQADPLIAGVFGADLNWPDATLVDRLGAALRRMPTTQAQYIPPYSPLFSNANSAVRRDIALAIPFCEALPASEDTFWAKRALAAGWRIYYQPTASVWHSHFQGLGDSLRVAMRALRAVSLERSGAC